MQANCRLVQKHLLHGHTVQSSLSSHVTGFSFCRIFWIDDFPSSQLPMNSNQKKGSVWSCWVSSGPFSSITQVAYGPTSIRTFPNKHLKNPLTKAKWFSSFHCQTLKRDFDKEKNTCDQETVLKIVCIVIMMGKIKINMSNHKIVYLLHWRSFSCI